MKKISAERARAYFQERVTANAKTLVDMADIVRRYPEKFNFADTDKVRVYLTNQLSMGLQSLDIALTTAVRTSFDLDMEHVPDAQDTALPMIARPSVPLTVAPGGAVRPKPAGRLFGSDEVVMELVPAAPVRRTKPTEDPKTVPDVTGMIAESGFIED